MAAACEYLYAGEHWEDKLDSNKSRLCSSGAMKVLVWPHKNTRSFFEITKEAHLHDYLSVSRATIGQIYHTYD